MSLIWQIVVCVCVYLALDVATFPQKVNLDAIGYPEVDENLNNKNKEGRLPLYAPSVCPENELYYPGDQKSDWICDCRPAFIYHPATDKCWAAWRRGPCPQAEYLTLTTGLVIPKCTNNPCVLDDYVSWNGTCHRLGSEKVCKHLYPTAAVLGVNATTLEVGCERLTLEMRFDEPPLTACSPGSRRSIDGKCVALTRSKD